MYYWFHQSFYMAKALPFIGGWLADRLFGDPEGWPHPVVGFGKVISLGEKTLNKGNDRAVKGGIMALILVAGTYLLCERILALAGYFHPIVASILSGIGVFYCLAGKTLVKEVKAVFEAVDRSTEEGRKQVGRIVGRDTSRLSPQEIRAAALETLAENLSDGVIAPMFWFALLGLPGMMAYKMVNTLDSMIGYKNETYLYFGRAAAKLDDVVNFIPAILSAWLMIGASYLLGLDGKNAQRIYKRDRKNHTSPNSARTESVCAGALGVQLAGDAFYFGQLVHKPTIGDPGRPVTAEDIPLSCRLMTLTSVLSLCLFLAVRLVGVLLW